MQFLLDGPDEAAATLLLAHGAGLPMDHPSMERIAGLIAAHGIRVARFEFPYMAARRGEGRRRPPDREPVLRTTWLDAIAELRGASQTFIGGRSMGGRLASMVADEADVQGLVCLGYPFHPVGHPERVRIAHLEHLQTPALIIQGERDPFGTRAEVAAYPLSPAIRLEWLTDGDHALRPRKASGFTHEEHLLSAASAVARFVFGQLGA